MTNKERESYIFDKKCLLILLYLFYINNVGYKDITLRSFGFHFDPKCDFKAIVHSKKDHIHKYVIHIFESPNKVNLEAMDVMGNVNFLKVKNLKNYDPYIPESSLNIYFDESNFLATGFIEGNKIEFTLKNKKDLFLDGGLLYLLNNEKNPDNEESFILYLLKLYTYKLNLDFVLGAGINIEYGAKDWIHLVDALNNTFYKDDLKRIEEIKHYVGSELFVNGKILKTSGFDTYKMLNDEIYLLNNCSSACKSFDDQSSTLYFLVDYIKNHKNTTVITYNYDTNLEYLCKKHGVRYNSSYDDSAFMGKDSLVSIYHVHGLMPFDKFKEDKYINSLIFNESDYFYLFNNPYSWNTSKQLHDFIFNTCIFVGISLTDPNMKRLLELATNYLKFNFIFMKKENGYDEKTYRDVTNYFFSYDLITIWLDDYAEINKWLRELNF